MSDIDYTFCPTDNAPEYLSERWGKPASIYSNGWVLFRGQCEVTECSYRNDMKVDEEGNLLKSVDEVVAEVAAIMASKEQAPIVLCRQHAQAVIRLIQPSPELV